MEKYMKSIDNSMRGIHKELKTLNKRGSYSTATTINNIESKTADAREISNQMSGAMVNAARSGLR